MTISRRTFARTATVAAFSLGITSGLTPTAFGQSAIDLFQLPGERTADPLEQLNFDKFEQCLNTEFLFQSENHPPATMRLIEVTDRRRAAAMEAKVTPAGECFSIVFRGPRRRVLSQHVYQIRHETLGEFSLLVVPMGHNRMGGRYEAIINRFHA